MKTDGPLRSLGYELVGSLGEGTFGMVKLATSERHSEQVAIKIMKPRRKNSKFSREYLPLELAILRRVRHPHIVQVHEIFQMPSGHAYVVMEAATTNLFRKVRELSFIPMDQARTWFSQLVCAVVYLHQQNIAHRDLKCMNVLLTADNQVKLTDFGIGRFYEGFPKLCRTYVCTPLYAAPEVLLRVPHDPMRSDVWSLGVIFYHMVTGRLPFKAGNRKRLPLRQLRPLEYPSNVEEPCRAFISYMLRYNALVRPSATKVAQHPWLQTSQEPLPHSSSSLEVQSGVQSSSRSLSVRSSPCVSELQKRNTDPEEAGPSRAATHSSSSVETSTARPSAARRIGRFLVVAVEDQDSLQQTQEVFQTSSCLSSGDGLEFVTCREVQPEPEHGSSGACRSVEVVGEECGCFGCSSFCAAAKACLVAPIVKASRSLRERMRRFFREQRRDNATPEVLLPQPIVKKRPKRQRLLQFKILKKTTKKGSSIEVV
ncbi:testis-specific serine/threonine-protein kinase 6-like [Salminus brasiliensis]|uniref:testis-specific serine/threonine-protein kinase 6-like n=1 Tax=Salminus brasiliensis TaxID=930266 RepID=UPI003B82DED6